METYDYEYKPSYHAMVELPPFTDVYYEDTRKPWTRRNPETNVVTTFTPVEKEWWHVNLPQWYMDATGKDAHAHCILYGKCKGKYHIIEFYHHCTDEYQMTKDGWACVRVYFKRFVEVFYFWCADLAGPVEVALEISLGDDRWFEIPTTVAETAVRGVYRVDIPEMASSGKLPGYIWYGLHPRDATFPTFRVNLGLVDYLRVRVRPAWGHFLPLEIDHAIRDAFAPTALFEFGSLNHNVLEVSDPEYRMQGLVHIS